MDLRDHEMLVVVDVFGAHDGPVGFGHGDCRLAVDFKRQVAVLVSVSRGRRAELG